jgi:hypothetical protein
MVFQEKLDMINDTKAQGREGAAVSELTDWFFL